MRRRAFITALCSAAIWPIAAHCQKSVPSIGLLGGGKPEGFEAVAAGFRESLRESGFIEGSNVTFEYRWARGQFEQLPRLATELVNRKPGGRFCVSPYEGT
jgi:putative tryptophan/tyrosine transport system substrate-binding protein